MDFALLIAPSGHVDILSNCMHTRCQLVYPSPCGRLTWINPECSARTILQSLILRVIAAYPLLLVLMSGIVWRQPGLAPRRREWRMRRKFRDTLLNLSIGKDPTDWGKRAVVELWKRGHTWAPRWRSIHNFEAWTESEPHPAMEARDEAPGVRKRGSIQCGNWRNTPGNAVLLEPNEAALTTAHAWHSVSLES